MYILVSIVCLWDLTPKEHDLLFKN